MCMYCKHTWEKEEKKKSKQIIQNVDVLLDDAIVYCDLLFEWMRIWIHLDVFDDNFTGIAAKSLVDRSSYVYNYQLDDNDRKEILT